MVYSEQNASLAQDLATTTKADALEIQSGVHDLATRSNGDRKAHSWKSSSSNLVKWTKYGEQLRVFLSVRKQLSFIDACSFHSSNFVA